MHLQTPQIAYLLDLMNGKVENRPGKSDFTANDQIALRQQLEGELANRKGVGIPHDWRELAAAYIAEGRPVTEFAPSHAIRQAESRASKIEAARIAALPANDLLGELGL